tara:strand:- start:8061 stop:8939 length:879 start_codon:yes stop_codon:yes gene_type:complete
MKKIILFVLLSLSSILNAQNYFNTITTKESKILSEVEIEETKSREQLNESSKEKNKEYYTQKVLETKSKIESLVNEKYKKDSINAENINYFKKQIIQKRDKKKEEKYLNEIDLIQKSSEKNNKEFIDTKLDLEQIQEKYKDTLYMVIKIEYLKTKINNKNGLLDTLKLQSPLKKNIHITSNYGYRVHPISLRKEFHNGIDIRSNSDEVFPVMPGTITKINYSEKLGIYVEITHFEEIKSIYGHLSKILLLENTKVDTNTAFAVTGETGKVTAAHLHFILKKGNQYINPTGLF